MLSVLIFIFLLLLLLGGALALPFARRGIAKELDKRACCYQNADHPNPIELKSDQAEVRILVLGDTGSGDEFQKKVALASARTCQEQGCDLIFLLGDNFIMDGVTGIEDPQFQSKFEEVYSQQLPFYAVLGNHDLRGNWKAQIEYSQHSARWRMPNVNYSIAAGPVLFQAINTTCTLCSLWGLFKRTSKPWKVVLGHHPMLTSGRHRAMTWLERLFFLIAKPQFFLAGHNHILEHLDYHGIDQIISGGGGNPIHPIQVDPSRFSQFLFQGLGYVWMRFTATEAYVYFYNAEGQSVYGFTRKQ